MRRAPPPLFPSPSTFASLLATFQRALVPSASRVPHVVGEEVGVEAAASFATASVPRRARSLADAIDVAAARVLARLKTPPTVALLTVSPAYGSAALDAPALLSAALSSRVGTIGAVAASTPGVSLWAASLPTFSALPFVSYGGALPAADWGRWATTDEAVATAAFFLSRASSSSSLAARLSSALPPGAAVAGGLLRGGGDGFPPCLFVDGRVAPDDAAAVGLLLRGSGVRVRAVAKGEGQAFEGASAASIVFADGAGINSISSSFPSSLLVDARPAHVGGRACETAALVFEQEGGA